jgi:AraC family transcriptional regulator of adaptative response/methylated-DNA-[protein]-cysteine methyltransferase
MSALQSAEMAVIATEQDPRWESVMARDPRADGTFYYSVRTTGVYCRPSCASRRANPRNVSFHATRGEAERAGFRPCRRCRPDRPATENPHAAAIAAICRTIEASDTPPTLDALARQAGLSPHHFHRVFKAVTGVTPRDYAAAHRMKRVRDGLGRTDTITEAIYDAGYNSGGRFYSESDRVLGMRPGDYRAGGRNAEIRFAVGECSLGSILVAQSARGVCAILLGDDAEALVRDLQDRFPQAALVGGDKGFEALVAHVVGFVERPSLGLELPLDVRGTAFQQRVWRALARIPAGRTASYADIARRIGAPASARAVAGACGTNPLAVAIPCHRVVRNDGSLSGYRWGIERKQALLNRERAQSRERSASVGASDRR